MYDGDLNTLSPFIKRKNYLSRNFTPLKRWIAKITPKLLKKQKHFTF